MLIKTFEELGDQFTIWYPLCFYTFSSLFYFFTLFRVSFQYSSITVSNQSCVSPPSLWESLSIFLAAPLPMSVSQSSFSDIPLSLSQSFSLPLCLCLSLLHSGIPLFLSVFPPVSVLQSVSFSFTLISLSLSTFLTLSACVSQSISHSLSLWYPSLSLSLAVSCVLFLSPSLSLSFFTASTASTDGPPTPTVTLSQQVVQLDYTLTK